MAHPLRPLSVSRSLRDSLDGASKLTVVCPSVEAFALLPFPPLLALLSQFNRLDNQLQLDRAPRHETFFLSFLYFLSFFSFFYLFFFWLCSSSFFKASSHKPFILCGGTASANQTRPSLHGYKRLPMAPTGRKEREKNRNRNRNRNRNEEKKEENKNTNKIK